MNKNLVLSSLLLGAVAAPLCEAGKSSPRPRTARRQRARAAKKAHANVKREEARLKSKADEAARHLQDVKPNGSPAEIDKATAQFQEALANLKAVQPVANGASASSTEDSVFEAPIGSNDKKAAANTATSSSASISHNANPDSASLVFDSLVQDIKATQKKAARLAAEANVHRDVQIKRLKIGGFTVAVIVIAGVYKVYVAPRIAKRARKMNDGRMKNFLLAVSFAKKKNNDTKRDTDTISVYCE